MDWIPHLYSTQPMRSSNRGIWERWCSLSRVKLQTNFCRILNYQRNHDVNDDDDANRWHWWWRTSTTVTYDSDKSVIKHSKILNRKSNSRLSDMSQGKKKFECRWSKVYYDFKYVIIMSNELSNKNNSRRKNKKPYEVWVQNDEQCVSIPNEWGLSHWQKAIRKHASIHCHIHTNPLGFDQFPPSLPKIVLFINFFYTKKKI